MLQLIKNILTAIYVWVAGLSILMVFFVATFGLSDGLLLVTVIFLVVGNGLLGIVGNQIREYIEKTNITIIPLEKED